MARESPVTEISAPEAAMVASPTTETVPARVSVGAELTIDRAPVAERSPYG